MTEYHKIETLYERDPVTFKVHPGVLKNRVYGLLKTWQWTEKIDGTNIRLIWRDGKLVIGGKTDNAQIHSDLLRYLTEMASAERMAAVFPDTPAVVYGEGFGAGIQKGGGYSTTKKLAVFDVLVSDKWWLSWENTCDVATKLGLETVPYIGEMSLEDATEYVRRGFPSAFQSNGTMVAEGMVGRPEETLFDKKGARLIVKLKTKDFAQEKP